MQRFAQPWTVGKQNSKLFLEKFKALTSLIVPCKYIVWALEASFSNQPETFFTKREANLKPETLKPETILAMNNLKP